MKKQLPLLITVPFLAILISCKNQSRTYDFSNYATKTTDTSTLSGTEESLNNRISLKPVTQIKYTDESVQRLQDEIDKSRREKSQKLLNSFSEPEERIDISNVSLNQENPEAFKIEIETINEGSKDTEELTFISNNESEGDLVEFDLDSGKNDHNVKTRGYCLELVEEVCSNLVVEVSYDLKGRTVIRQFNFETKPVESVQESDQVQVKPEAAQEEDIKEEKEVVTADRLEPESEDVELEDAIKPKVQTLAVEEKVETETVEVETIKVEEKPLVAQEEEAKEIIVEETKEEKIEKPIRPKMRPDGLVTKLEEEETEKEEESPLAPKQSLRPKARPGKFELIKETGIVDGEETSLAPGIYVLPDKNQVSDIKPRLHFRDLGVEVNSYAELDPKDFPISEDEEETVNFISLLSGLKAKAYNQSKGGYGGRLGRGWIKDSSALANPAGDTVHPRVKSKKFGSGLTIDFLTWLGKEYLAKYPNDSLCVNHISDHNGGEIGHKSHENGLDIDMNIPSSVIDCKKRGLKDYRKPSKEDRDFFKKNYDLLKMMISTNRVHVIFIDRSFIKNMCNYTKTLSLNTEEKEQRKSIFKKLFHVGGHANHYHIRMVCNEQNLGCKSQGRLKPNVSTDCD